MPKLGDALLTVAQKESLKKIKNPEKYNIRIGAFYSKFNTHQRARFNRLVNSFSNRLGLDQRCEPIKLTLIRYIAVHVIRLDDVLSEIFGGTNLDYDYGSDREKWLLLNRKELREGISLLHTICQVAKKKEGIGTFDKLRDTMRKEEDLPESKEKGIAPTGKDRRYHDDGVTRSVQ